MGIGIAVKFADIGDIRFAPVRMALCADTCHSCQPMYSNFVTFRMADFCGIRRQISLSVCLFSGLNSRRTAVFGQTDDLGISLELTLSLPASRL